jgi:hypothetical protein
MSTDFRALCLELLQFGDQAGEIAANEGLWPDCDPGPDWLLDRARAALAQPEPVAPNHAEICRWLSGQAHWGPHDPNIARVANLVQYALARYARAAIQPVLASEQWPARVLRQHADALTAPSLLDRALSGDSKAARQFLHEAGFTDQQGQWLPQYQPINQEDYD